MEIDRYLRNAKLLRGLNESQLQLFRRISETTTVDAGTQIFRKGQKAKTLYIVGRGRVALEMDLDRPDGSVTGPTTVASIGPGETFGWSAIVAPHRLTLTARAVKRSVLLCFDGQRFRGLLASDPLLGYRVLLNVATLLARRLSETRETLAYDHSWLLQTPNEK